MKPTPIGIWFTQGFANLFHAMQDIREADKAGEFTLICSHPNPQFVGQESADISLMEPVSNKGFLKFIKEVVTEFNVKVILPSRRQTWFNRNKKAIEALGVQVLTVASSATLNRIEDKAALYLYLKGKHVVNIPAFSVFKSLAEFDAAQSILGQDHPILCIKPTHGVYGSGFRILKAGNSSMRDLLTESLNMGVQDLRSRLAADNTNPMMLMEYLDGDERSVDCLADNGVLIAGVIRRKSTSAIAPQVIEQSPLILAQVQVLAKLLKLTGLFNVQFKDHDGKPFLLEINTRLSGRSYYATIAGCNLPYLAAQRFGNAVPVSNLVFDIDYGMRIGSVTSAVVINAPMVGISSASAKESS